MPGAIELACGDHSFPLLEHEHAVSLVGMLGFRGFDLAVMGNRSHVRPENIRGDISGWAEKIRSTVDRAGLELADVFLIPWTDFETLAPNHPDDAVRSDSRGLFRDVLDFAARLGAPGVTLLPGAPFAGEHPEGSLRRAADELQWRAARAHALGLRCSIEAHIGSIVETPEAVLALLELAPDLELTLDYTHFIAQGIEQQLVDPLASRARHVHVRGARLGRGQCSMSSNTIDHSRVLAALEAQSYSGYVAIEYVWTEWEHMNECDNISETVLLRDDLRSLLAPSGA